MIHWENRKKMREKRKKFERKHKKKKLIWKQEKQIELIWKQEKKFGKQSIWNDAIQYNGSSVIIRIIAIFMIKLITRNRMMIWIIIMFVVHPCIFFFLQKRVPSSSWRRNHWLKSGADPFFLGSLSFSPSWLLYISLSLFLLVSFFSFSLLSSFRPCPCFYPFYFCNRTPRAYAPTFWHRDVTALVPPRLRITDTWLRLIYKLVMSLWNTAS